jgi:ribosomal protein L37AE/L43A
MKKFLEPFRLFYNKIRINLLRIFTNRVKDIVVKDKQGNKIKATIEQKETKLCPHDLIKQIAPTMWVCQKCKEKYYFISSKIELNETQLLSYLDDISKYLKKHD